MASEEEFAEFVAGALPGLLRFGHVLTGHPQEAEDLVQTALGRSLRAWRLRRIDDPRAFVRKVMVNSYASWYGRHRGREWTTPDLSGHGLVEDHARQVGERDVIWRALRTLPARQRAVIVLRYYEDLPDAQIAVVMGTSIGTVKSQMSRGMKRLADVLVPAQEIDSTTVTPINTATNTAGPPIKVGNNPGWVTISPDGKTAYVVNTGLGTANGTVTPIDTATNRPEAPIQVGRVPARMVITPDGKTGYVVNDLGLHEPGTVTPISTATNTPGKPITVGVQPWQIAITPNGKTVYVASATMHTGMVTPINTATNTAGKPIVLNGAGPLAIGPTLSATSP